MGTDIYHSLNDDAPANLNPAIATAYEAIIERLKNERPDFDPCNAYGCETCRRNDEETRIAILELSRAFPDVTFTLATTWYCEDDPTEYLYARAGKAMVAPVVKVVASANVDAMAEPKACSYCGCTWECDLSCKNSDRYSRSGAPVVAMTKAPEGYEIES